MKRILLRSPNWIGDQVLAYPFYRFLRQAYPDAWIGAICTEWVRDIQFKGLVDEVFILPRKKGDSLLTAAKTVYTFSKKLKEAGPWDLGITLPNSFGGALLMKMAGVRDRRGYDTDARGFLLTNKIPWNADPTIHRAQAYANLLTQEYIPEYDMRDYWKMSAEKKFDPIRYWPDIEPIVPPKEDYFLIAPGATASSRRWSTEQFSDLIARIQAKHGWQCLVIGGNAEKAIAAELYRSGHDIQDFTAKGWVAQHWKLFQNAKFTVCNESGLAHVAALCGSPVHIICGAADPKRTQPIGPGPVQVTINPVECWPCERNVCQFTDERRNQCLKGIFPERVFEEIELELDRKS